MLQQSRVATVIRYYEAWLAAFPTVFDLATATMDQVHSVWAGLGYYRRAKMLHEGAKKLVADYKGQLPDTVEELRKIPGIGPYTAGAIASIAFGKPEPLVDGNVFRVLSRLRLIDAAYSSSGPHVKLAWKLADQILDRDSPGISCA